MCLQAVVCYCKSLAVPGDRLALSGYASGVPGASWNHAFEGTGLERVLSGEQTIIGRSPENNGHETGPYETVLLELPIVTDGLAALKNNLEAHFADRLAPSLAAYEPAGESWVVSLIEVERAFVLHLAKEELEERKALVSLVPYILWITRDGQLRVEMAKLRIPHLDVSLSPELNPASARAAEFVHWCFFASPPAQAHPVEMEYAEKNGDVLIPRFSSTPSAGRPAAS